jgi:hypothetical protein
VGGWGGAASCLGCETLLHGTLGSAEIPRGVRRSSSDRNDTRVPGANGPITTISCGIRPLTLGRGCKGRPAEAATTSVNGTGWLSASAEGRPYQSLRRGPARPEPPCLHSHRQDRGYTGSLALLAHDGRTLHGVVHLNPSPGSRHRCARGSRRVSVRPLRLLRIRAPLSPLPGERPP